VEGTTIGRPSAGKSDVSQDCYSLSVLAPVDVKPSPQLRPIVLEEDVGEGCGAGAAVGAFAGEAATRRRRTIGAKYGIADQGRAEAGAASIAVQAPAPLLLVVRSIRVAAFDDKAIEDRRRRYGSG